MKRKAKGIHLAYFLRLVVIVQEGLLKPGNVRFSGWLSMAGITGGIILLVAENAYQGKRVCSLEEKDAS